MLLWFTDLMNVTEEAVETDDETRSLIWERSWADGNEIKANSVSENETQQSKMTRRSRP